MNVNNLSAYGYPDFVVTMMKEAQHQNNGCKCDFYDIKKTADKINIIIEEMQKDIEELKHGKLIIEKSMMFIIFGGAIALILLTLAIAIGVR